MWLGCSTRDKLELGPGLAASLSTRPGGSHDSINPYQESLLRSVRSSRRRAWRMRRLKQRTTDRRKHHGKRWSRWGRRDERERGNHWNWWLGDGRKRDLRRRMRARLDALLRSVPQSFGWALRAVPGSGRCGGSGGPGRRDGRGRRSSWIDGRDWRNGRRRRERNRRCYRLRRRNRNPRRRPCGRPEIRGWGGFGRHGQWRWRC